MQFISHRDNIRADELRQQAYESSLDSLGLKILDRRLRRDYAERSRKKKYNDTIRLNDQMKEEMIKQETRAHVLKLEKEKNEGKFLDDFTKVFSIVASTLTTILLASRL